MRRSEQLCRWWWCQGSEVVVLRVHQLHPASDAEALECVDHSFRRVMYESGKEVEERWYRECDAA